MVSIYYPINPRHFKGMVQLKYQFIFDIVFVVQIQPYLARWQGGTLECPLNDNGLV
jgi:hypothetical protein